MTIRLSYQSAVPAAPAHRSRRWAAVPRANGASPALRATRIAANKAGMALHRSERAMRSSTRRWTGTSGSAIVETAVTLIVSVALTVFAALSAVDVAASKVWMARDQVAQASRVTLQDPGAAALATAAADDRSQIGDKEQTWTRNR